MSKYDVTYKRQALNELKRIPPKLRTRILEAIAELASIEKREWKNVVSLKGRRGYRLRVGGFRVLFDCDDELKIIAVEKVGPRGDIY
nr:type II toxin-antitoxin system RelE/ParE family toxin [uncultured Cohaesibacter sp.]